jgi:hypothetical protein
MEDGGRNWIERSELLILLRCVLPSHHMSVAIWYTSQGAKEEANWLNLYHTHETLQSPCNMAHKMYVNRRVCRVLWRKPHDDGRQGKSCQICWKRDIVCCFNSPRRRKLGCAPSRYLILRLQPFPSKHVAQNILGWYRAVQYEHTVVYVQTWASGKSESLYFRSLWGITLFTLFLFSTQIHRTINIHIFPYNRSSLIFKSRVAAAASGSRIYAALRRATLHGTRWLIASD